MRGAYLEQLNRCGQCARFVAVVVASLLGWMTWPAWAQTQSGGKDQVNHQAADSDQGKAVALFNGKNLEGWRVIDTFDFRRHGKVSVQDGSIVMAAGQPATGISWKGDFPRMNYEVSLEAKRTKGDDFFCGMTFPYQKSYCTFIVGGWGGGVTGLSNVDDQSAVENETTDYMDFKRDRWYRIRVRVTAQKIEAWIDKERMVDLETKGRKLSVWWEQEPVRPFGVATWYTAAAVRHVRLRRLP